MAQHPARSVARQTPASPSLAPGSHGPGLRPQKGTGEWGWGGGRWTDRVTRVRQALLRSWESGWQGPRSWGRPWREWPLGFDVGRSRAFQVKGEGGNSVPQGSAAGRSRAPRGLDGEQRGGLGGRGGGAGLREPLDLPPCGRGVGREVMGGAQRRGSGADRLDFRKGSLLPGQAAEAPWAGRAAGTRGWAPFSPRPPTPQA